jgi:glycosyltransferase involved in cell wall biosynthesis
MHKKVAIFAPHYPPVKGGVSDYTSKLFDEFQKQDIPSLVITKKSSLRKKSPSIVEVELPTAFTSFQSAIIDNNVTDLLIEYTPKSFNPKTLGINLWLVIHILRIRKIVNVHLYAHETNYPIEFTKAGILLGPIHTIQFYLLSLLSKTTTFSTKRFEEKWKKRIPIKSRAMHTIPIGSNIEPVTISTQNQKDQVIFFGSNHPTCLKEQALETMIHIANKKPHINFVILGLKESDLSITTHHDRFEFPGYLSESQISKYYNESKLSILPLMDGCSTRRGTLMCSIAHGVPVLTNYGESTDQSIPWKNFCYISEEQEFNNQAIDALGNSDILKAKQVNAYNYYNSHLAWPVIVKELIRVMSNTP